jgi:hypothetical protein
MGWPSHKQIQNPNDKKHKKLKKSNHGPPRRLKFTD